MPIIPESKAKKSSRIFIKKFYNLKDRLSPKDVSFYYPELNPEVMNNLRQHFEKYVTLKDQATVEDHDFVKFRIAYDLTESTHPLNSNTQFYTAVRNFLLNHPENYVMEGTASKLVANRAKEPNEDELSRAEYNAASNEEQQLAKKYERRTEVFTEVFARLNVYYEEAKKDRYVTLWSHSKERLRTAENNVKYYEEKLSALGKSIEPEEPYSGEVVSGDINSLPYWKAMLKQSRDRIRIAEKRVKLLEDAYGALRNADEAKATI
jgi:hypothetical protein